MSVDPPVKRATVRDVAREANVSLATVDRVLNGRPGVRRATIDKVEAAISAINFTRDVTASMLARSRDINIQIIMPAGSNQFMASLAKAIDMQTRQACAERIHIETQFITALDSDQLAKVLADLTPQNCNCAVIVASDDQKARAAVNATVARGIPILTLVSDLPGTARRHFIGIDNRAAGRTAASLMGRFCAGSGQIALIAGSLELADHRARFEGFQEITQSEFPNLNIIGPVEGYDDPEKTGECMAALLAEYSDLTGVYSIGAGNSGLIAALQKSDRARALHVIAHELTDSTREALVSGDLGVVIDQNPEGEIRAAIAAARQIALQAPESFFPEPVEIGIFLRDNLR